MPLTRTSIDPPILFFDGTCALCNRAVRFLAFRSKPHGLRFAPIGGETSRVRLANSGPLPDSIVLLHDGRIYLQSEAIIQALTLAGGFWRLAPLAHVIPRGLRDAVYDCIARNRYRWFGRADTCGIPSDELRDALLP